MQDLSVIIVNYRGWERLEKCLSSLINIHDHRFSFEVVVIDNQSNDDRLSEFIKLFPQINFITNPGKKGFANGCNLGAARSTGNCLLFLNPDTTMTADILSDMLENVKVGPKCSVLSYRKVQENGSNGLPHGDFLTLSTMNGWLKMIRKVFYGDAERSKIAEKHYEYPDWVFGSAFMITRNGFFQMGEWDEDFWMYFEDENLYCKDYSSNREIVKLKNGVIAKNYRCLSKIVPNTTVIIKSVIHQSNVLKNADSSMIYESPCWF